MAPPPPDGSRGCVATIRRLMQGVGHTVPCNTSRQAALQARWMGWVGTGEQYTSSGERSLEHQACAYGWTTTRYIVNLP